MRKAKRRKTPAYQAIAVAWWEFGTMRSSEEAWELVAQWLIGSARVYSCSRLSSAQKAADDLLFLSKIAIKRQGMAVTQLRINWS